MTDCVSLPNAAELVNFLRGEAKELSMLANGKTECNALWKAADAIEQLLSENAKLKELYDKLDWERIKLKAERDAAVEDLKDFSDSESSCFYCRKINSAGCTECSWEWRGIKEGD